MNNSSLRVAKPTLETINILKKKLKMDNQNDVIIYLVDRNDILKYIMELKEDKKEVG